MEEDNAPAGDSGKRTRKHGGGQCASWGLRKEDKETWRRTRCQPGTQGRGQGTMEVDKEPAESNSLDKL